MQKIRLTLLTLAGLSLVAMPALAGKPTKPDPPRGNNHYTMHILGKANCDQNVDEDCWNAQECVDGKKGGVCSNGHTLFVPMKTIESDICDADPLNGVEVTWDDLLKGVHILVTDGDDFTIPDRDGTDGKARFTIPFGCYDVWARAHGKPNGCMEINSLICEDCMYPELTGDTNVCDDPSEFEQVNCDNDSGNDKYVLQGTLDVRRNSGERQHWQNATNELLGASSALTSSDNGTGSYFDFLWELYNNQLRNLELRFYQVDCN